MAKRIICAALCAALCLAGGGCVSIYSNYRDVGELHLIQTLGFDDGGDGLLRLTIASGRSGESGSTVMSLRGESVTDAINRLRVFSVREDMSYAHARYAVLGSDFAENDMSQCLDFFFRSVQIRMDVGLVVLRGATAEDLITAAGEGGATDVLSSMDRIASRDGWSHIFSFQEIARSLTERGAALVGSIGAEDTEGIVFSESGSLAAVPRGYAVVVGRRVEGYLEGESARGVDLLLGLGGGGSAVVEAPGGLKATLGIRSDGCSIKPVWRGGELEAIEVECKLNCAVSELEGGGLLSFEEAEALSAEAGRLAEGWLLDTLELVKIYRADCLGLCDYVRRVSPEEFAAIEGSWAEQLSQAELRVSVSAELERDYDLRSMPRGGQEAQDGK